MENKRSMKLISLLVKMYIYMDFSIIIDEGSKHKTIIQ